MNKVQRIDGTLSIYSAAVLTKECKSTDWFEADVTVMEPVIDTKHSALISYKRVQV